MNRAVIGLGSCGVAAGGREVEAAVAATLQSMSLAAQLQITGCSGLCYREVLLELESPAMGRCLYGDVTAEAVPGLLEAHFRDRAIVDRLLIARDHGSSGDDLFPGQRRLVLRNCGVVDPTSVDDYLAAGGYRALERAVHQLEPAQVIDEIAAAGLRGRGGAGYPTALKWRAARATPGPIKYVICNADEGDPGAFMDRNLIEGDPFAVLEGLTIAAYAIGASEGFIYVRDEYPLAITRLEAALVAARDRGLLGDAIAGSSFRFDVALKRGAGAFVCGEETALIASLEGRRGMPRNRPPYPVESGLHGRPTCINNVETLANVPWIIGNGADDYRRYGTAQCPGTKVFSLAGDVARTGMIEVPMGITIAEIVDTIGGGSGTGRPIKAVQIGGPAGGCLPVELFAETRVDYESLADTGAIMGSGGLVVMDSSNCMVDVARYFLAFSERESCGKCTFCRIGTTRMLEILDRLCAGKGRRSDLDALETLSLQVGGNSLCGLGKAAPNPVLTTLRYFRGEYEAHLDRICPAGRCRDLITFRIQQTMCEGCTLCLEQCAIVAISERPRIIPLAIDEDVCVRCGGCFHTCPYDAITVQ